MGATKAPVPVSRAGVIYVDGLKVRSNASASSIVDVLNKGEKATVEMKT